MPSTAEVLVNLASSTRNSTPPVQWVWMLLLAVGAAIFGYMLARETDQSAAAAAALELDRLHTADLKARAAVEADMQEHNRLLAVAAELERAIKQRQVELEAQLALLEAKKAAIEKARNWRELEAV